MLSEIITFNVTQEMLNQTKIEQLQAVATQPYSLLAFAMAFGLAIFLWLCFGFARVSKHTIGFQSWIHWRALVFLLIALGILFVFFIYPTMFSFVR